jgi:signal transduction histidine kinase
VLGFETTRREGDRTDDDIALFRTAAEIFANAIERDRKESENQALQTQVRRAQRLEAIGTLTGGIAHNFNNILGAVLGYSEMALGKLATDSQPARYVREARQAGLRAQSVVDQMLTFSRRADHAHRIVLMRTVLDEAVQLLRASLPATVNINVSTSGEADTAAVRGDATQLQQVVMNFCTNAAHAMDERGTIDVALEMADVGQETPLSHGTLARGRYIRLTVHDTGRGIDPATLERIFEPFFTTRRAGTGLGLATVHGIIADHGGALNVLSRPGFGSRFEAYVAAADTDVHEGDDTGVPVPTGQGETILLVEDDRPLMLLGEEMVASLGYEPVGFHSGARALTYFQADPDRFDLVLTDEVVPEITGMDLALAMHRMRPEMPIILVTGQSAPLSRELLQAADIREVLRKPLLMQELGGALARHLPARARRAVG